MSKAESTHPNVLANIRVDPDPDQPDYRSGPAMVPDHGAQPRLPPRPSANVYKLDPNNLRRPADDPYLESTQEGYDERKDEEYRLARERKIVEERRVVKWLDGAIRKHAPKLDWRRERDLEEAIEDLMSLARSVTSWLPPKPKARVLAKFNDELRAQIALNRKNRRITKI
jgi:hypothetical protein